MVAYILVDKHEKLLVLVFPLPMIGVGQLQLLAKDFHEDLQNVAIAVESICQCWKESNDC